GTTDLAGITGLSPSLDSLGLLTRTVADLEYVYTAFSGRPARTPQRRLVSGVLLWEGSELAAIDPPMRELLDTLPGLLIEA
ncbi:amidase, partial [Streptomyces sp. SID10244]|nr:amidase [Streptomyces sp. SID10244]